MPEFFLIFLNVVLATGIYVAFRLIPRYKADPFQVLSVNYLFATVTAFFSLSNPSASIDFIQKLPAALPVSVFLGILFVLGYIFLVQSTAKTGIGISSAAAKMAVVMPVFVGILFLGQTSGLPYKIAGLACVLLSFVFIFLDKTTVFIGKTGYLYPLLVFLSSGLVDSFLALSRHFFISSSEENSSFLLLVFVSASLFSFVLFMRSNARRKQKIRLSALVLGFFIGVLNFCSTFLIIQSIQNVGETVFFPIFNSSIVVLSALIGVLFFKEKLSVKNCIGFAFAILGVILVAVVV